MRAFLPAAALGLLVYQLHAGVVVYEGADPGADIGDPRPNSDAAAALFQRDAGLLGAISSIDFENLALGDFVSMSIGAGVTATLSGTSFGDGGIVADGWFGGQIPPQLGYNTTLGGDQFLGVVPIFDIGTVTVTFEFDIPIQAIGLYVTGFEGLNSDLDIELRYTNGATANFTKFGLGEDIGGVNFWGAIDAGASIDKVTLTHTDIFGPREIYGIDDIRFVAPPDCPWDLDGNGVVGVGDLLMLVANFGPCDGECPADFDEDGFVGASDLLALIANLGECPGTGCPWDVNGDGVVDRLDVMAVNDNMGPCKDPDNCPWDVNGDGVVDGADVSEVATHFGPCPKE